MGVLPSLQDNQTVVNLERQAQALAANLPIKLDASLINTATAAVSKLGGQLGAAAQALNDVTKAGNSIAKSVTDRISSAQGLLTNPNLVNGDGSGLSNLANNLKVSLSTVPNPLSAWVTYSYHIRWFITDEVESYNVSESNPNSDGMSKIVIAERAE
jgi:hypothetical protein